MNNSGKMKSTDPLVMQLWQQATCGDRLATQELCTRFTPLILHMAHYYQTDALALDDVIQVGFEHLLRAIREFDPTQGVYFAYFLKLRVRTGMWSFVRSAKRTASRVQKMSVNSEEPENGDFFQRIPDEMALAAYEHVEWADLFDLLSPRERIAMEELVLQGLSSTEVAATYGVSADTVKTWRKRALKKLNRALRP